MNDLYKLKLSNLIPVKGLIDYCERNRKDENNFLAIDMRLYPLIAYNVILIGTPLLYGLEKLLN